MGEHHAEAVCAAALSHVAAAATAQLPIKLVILHNRPGHFEKPLRALITSHVSNVVFCSYAGLLSGEARRALFGDDYAACVAKDVIAKDRAVHGDASSPSPNREDAARGTPSTLATLAATSRSGNNSYAISRSTRLTEGVSGYIGGPGVDSSGWGISQRQLSDDDALQCLLGQVAVGCVLNAYC